MNITCGIRLSLGKLLIRLSLGKCYFVGLSCLALDTYKE